MGIFFGTEKKENQENDWGNFVRTSNLDRMRVYGNHQETLNKFDKNKNPDQININS